MGVFDHPHDDIALAIAQDEEYRTCLAQGLPLLAAVRAVEITAAALKQPPKEAS